MSELHVLACIYPMKCIAFIGKLSSFIILKTLHGEGEGPVYSALPSPTYPPLDPPFPKAINVEYLYNVFFIYLF